MENGIILLVEDNLDDEALALRALKKNNISNKALRTVMIKTMFVTLPSDCNSVIIPIAVAGDVDNEVPANKIAKPKIIN